VFPDGDHAILITASEPTGRTLPLLERLRLLVEGVARPIAAFAADGMRVGASDAAGPLLGFRDLPEAARNDALDKGRAELAIDGGQMPLHRVGSNNDVGIVALIPPHAAIAETTPEIELVDVFAEPLDEVAPDQTLAGAPHEPSPYVDAVADEPAALDAPEA